MREVRTYNQVFRIERTVYSIQGVQLPFPVSYRQFAFFVVSLLGMVVLNRFPPFSWLDFYLLKFVGIPVLIAWFFTRKTLDGKAPHRFLLRYLEHRLSNHHFARYQEIPKSIYQYQGSIAFRHPVEVSRHDANSISG